MIEFIQNYYLYFIALVGFIIFARGDMTATAEDNKWAHKIIGALMVIGACLVPML